MNNNTGMRSLFGIPNPTFKKQVTQAEYKEITSKLKQYTENMGLKPDLSTVCDIGHATVYGNLKLEQHIASVGSIDNFELLPPYDEPIPVRNIN